jgi:hypothetical protein
MGVDAARAGRGFEKGTGEVIEPGIVGIAGMDGAGDVAAGANPPAKGNCGWPNGPPLTPLFKSGLAKDGMAPVIWGNIILRLNGFEPVVWGCRNPVGWVCTKVLPPNGLVGERGCCSAKNPVCCGSTIGEAIIFCWNANNGSCGTGAVKGFPGVHG